MYAITSFPLSVEAFEVADVECQDCPPLACGIDELILIGDVLIGSPGPLAAFGVVGKPNQGARQPRG